MLLILTITLNPAVDKTIQLDNFQLDQVNRVQAMRIDAGGKGINVSHTIKAMGRESKAFAVIGGHAGEFIKTEMNKEGIEFDYLNVDSETRTNLKIVDSVNNVHTDINEAGPEVDSSFENTIIKRVDELIHKGDVLVLSGSLLPGLTVTLYKKLIDVTSKKEAQVILDADGETLREALKASPDVIKPNIHELRRLVSKVLDHKESIVSFARELIKNGSVKKGILVSLGDQGALWITKDKVLVVDAVQTKVKSTVGAGDAMVAALAIGLSEKMSDVEMLKLATAAAVARISSDGPIQCSLKQLRDISEQVNIYEYKVKTRVLQPKNF